MEDRNYFELTGKKIWVAGHNGMVGSALTRRLASENCELIYADRKEIDLTLQQQTYEWIEKNCPDVIILAAAKVGGILANDTYPADFLMQNLQIQTNVIDAARRLKSSKLIFLGSSCIYPKFSVQPITEECLLTGSLEPTNEWYAIAKIAGLKLTEACRKQYGLDFISAMPTNLYGPGDNFDLNSSHVIPAIIRKAHEAKVSNSSHFSVWGSGAPLREFLHVDDCADAIVLLLKSYSDAQHINIGSGSDISIKTLAEVIAEVVGFKGRIDFDSSKPDGTMRKLMSASRLQLLNWKPKISLKEGLKTTYDWYLNNISNSK